MREIKFRAWDGKKIDYDPICCTDGPEITSLNSNIEHLFEDWHNPKYLALMQYTGLKDKNGKEIYTGYICEVKAPRSPDKEEQTGVKIEVKDFLTMLEEDNLWFWETPQESREVIGNIYENPELLK